MWKQRMWKQAPEIQVELNSDAMVLRLSIVCVLETLNTRSRYTVDIGCRRSPLTRCSLVLHNTSGSPLFGLL